MKGRVGAASSPGSMSPIRRRRTAPTRRAWNGWWNSRRKTDSVPGGHGGLQFDVAEEDGAVSGPEG